MVARGNGFGGLPVRGRCDREHCKYIAFEQLSNDNEFVDVPFVVTKSELFS